MDRPLGLPDWRDATAYEPLLDAERSVFAWEWLRRQTGYRTAAILAGAFRARDPSPIRCDPEAAAWGLHAFEDPALTAPNARPIWSSDRYPWVLNARAEPTGEGPDAFDLERLAGLALLAISPSAERLLLSDGYRSLRLDVRGCGLGSGPVRLHYEASGIESAGIAAHLLMRFLAVVTRGALTHSLHPPDRRAKRQILLLRAHDALANGASQRAIAAGLLSVRASEPLWRIESPSLRAQSQRLVRASRAMAAGAFWDLLR